MSWWEFTPYVPVAEKRERAQKLIAKMRKKNPGIQPVTIEGRKIARTFWGIAWNKNLESYADYENRIGRGRSYVINGFVLDLRIEKGFVKGLVMGSRKEPYSVEIEIERISAAKWSAITGMCGNRIDGMSELVEGRFPTEYADFFLKQGEGLFPSPKEIRMNCSCPDWAGLCKHTAAVLYGIGARLDLDPLLFFKLRDVHFEELLKKSVEEKMTNLLKNAGKRTERVIDDADIAGIFGVD